MAIADGLLGVAAALAAVVALRRSQHVLIGTGTPEEFAGGMFVAGGGMALALLAGLLALVSFGCVLLYRRVSKRGRLGLLGACFLAMAMAPPAAVLILLLK